MAIASISVAQLEKRSGLKVQILLNAQPHWISASSKLVQTEISQLFFKALNQPKEGILTIKLGGVPSLIRIRREEFNVCDRVRRFFLGIERRQLLSDRLWQEFHNCHL
jgi:hypothetical protein